MLKKTIITLTLIATAQLAQAEDMTSTPAEAKEIVKAISGKWRDESVAQIDSPNGNVKKGDKVINIIVRKPVAGGYGFVTEIFWQDGDISTDFGAYDPTSKTLKAIGTNSNGGYLNAVIWKASKNVIKASITITPIKKGDEELKGTVEWHLAKGGRTIEVKIDLNGVKNTIKSTRLAD